MKHILLVDDEAIIGVEFKRTLERFGYRVEMSQTLESALSRIHEARFDVILVEFNLRTESSSHFRAGNGLQLPQLGIFTFLFGWLENSDSLSLAIIWVTRGPAILYSFHPYLLHSKK